MSRFDWNPDSHLNMPNRDIVDLLTRDDFLRELHHLLWMEPAERRGKWDPGWNCRDHAFIVGFVVRLLRSEAEVILGRAMFIVGPSGEKVPLGLEQSLHAWLAIDGDGYFDLSLRLDESVMPGGNWLAWPVKALAANQFVPSEVASFIHTAQAQNYEQKNCHRYARCKLKNRCISSRVCSCSLDEALAIRCVPVLQFSADNYASQHFR
jgi:hypothetical protein